MQGVRRLAVDRWAGVVRNNVSERGQTVVGRGCQTKESEHSKLVKAVVKDTVGTLYGPLCLRWIRERRCQMQGLG